MYEVESGGLLTGWVKRMNANKLLEQRQQCSREAVKNVREQKLMDERIEMEVGL